MRTGILGGTFNPIHNTHINIAKAAMEQFALDEILVIPAGIPPHKQMDFAATNAQRAEMIRLAIKGLKGFKLDLREINSQEISYSYITLSKLKEERPEDELYFIMGSDSLLSFKTWMKPEIISQKATVLCAYRASDDRLLLEKEVITLNEQFEGEFHLVEVEATMDASSEIRRRALDDEDFSEFVNPLVAEYIEDHKVYSKDYTFEDVEKLLHHMKDELKPGRFIHTVGVCNTAGQLAVRFGYPMYDAMVAGALHDCAKCLSDEKRIEICRKNGIEIRPIEMQYPHLLHGKVGAHLAKHKYGITDEMILHAIVYHTTGCPGMSLLDKIIYIADYIEPGRDKAPNLSNVRCMAYENLDECLYMILKDTVDYLGNMVADGKIVDELTTKTYEFYKAQLGKE